MDYRKEEFLLILDSWEGDISIIFLTDDGNCSSTIEIILPLANKMNQKLRFLTSRLHESTVSYGSCASPPMNHLVNVNRSIRMFVENNDLIGAWNKNE